jgi:gluconolactonase
LLSDYVGDGGMSDIGACYLFRLDPRSAEIRAVVTDMVRPNGLAFSPDEKILYVADSGMSHTPDGPHHIKAFDVHADGTLAGASVFAVIDPGLSDGLRVDADGNVWTSAGDGVHCLAPDGELIGKVRLPEAATNLVFGGADRNQLFITGITSLYCVTLGARGAQRP